MRDGGRVRIEQADALTFLRGLEADSVDLVFTSPPYLAARTYGIGADIKCPEKWTAWMVEIVTECVRVCKGLTAVVCEGQTRNYRYMPAPFLLAADLHRAGFNLRKPVVFHRVGIPGSGGPDWLRNDWEPVVCASRDGRLPWSNNVAEGHAPKWAPGGELSYRRGDGTRVNKWGSTLTGMNSRNANGKMKPMCEPSRVVMTRERPGTHSQKSTVYGEPAIANPGNVIRCNAGGNAMGHDLAHENEAPFPLKLATFFVRSFCPPGGVACDPFSGSGTTAHAAYEHGRRFVGCDIRQSQVDLAYRRLATVTASMFDTHAAS